MVQLINILMPKSPYNRYSDRVVTNLKLKKLSMQIIVKTRDDDNCQLKTSLMGQTKNDFIDDCLQRGLTESEVLRSILKLHYEIINSLPQLKGKEFEEIKSFMICK